MLYLEALNLILVRRDMCSELCMRVDVNTGKHDEQAQGKQHRKISRSTIAAHAFMARNSKNLFVATP